ncbi:hypothetical protein O3M35_000415 [Rhynocoris fuscipes]|uniref:N-terminal methionine N(alpha)-acetyltransferase NatE n=1 Tax=Rhynocoris fuscipes TaxID=488301 RepID=A0AAW1DNB7_9HEMI
MTRSRIELGDVTPHNIKQLKKLNTVVFPVSYNEKFYKDVLEVGELAKLAYYNDIVVGAVCCRVDTSENSRRLYIMTLGCLSPYRRLGVGTTMVEHVLKHVEKDGNYDNVYLHVQVNNTGAIDFYKKFGFEIHETKKHYYKRIEPADAHVLQKTLRPNRPAAITNGLSPHHNNDNGRQSDKNNHHHHHSHHNDRNHHHHHNDKKQSEK